VDDWYKSASFGVGATPRRSTSSLDDMSRDIAFALIQAGFALILVLGVATFVTMRGIVARPKTAHHVPWVRLGCPEAFTSMMASRGDLYANCAGQTTLTLWLSRGDYLEINDPIVTSLANRRKFFRRAVVVIVIALFLVSTWLRHYD
jgi:hypothetical protein